MYIIHAHLYLYMMYQMRSTKYLNKQISKYKGNVQIYLRRMYEMNRNYDGIGTLMIYTNVR